MTWDILQGGAITSNVQLQRELTTEAFLTYQKTVLTALQDVENALVAFAKRMGPPQGPQRSRDAKPQGR